MVTTRDFVDGTANLDTDNLQLPVTGMPMKHLNCTRESRENRTRTRRERRAPRLRETLMNCMQMTMWMRLTKNRRRRKFNMDPLL